MRGTVFDLIDEYKTVIRGLRPGTADSDVNTMPLEAAKQQAIEGLEKIAAWYKAHAPRD